MKQSSVAHVPHFPNGKRQTGRLFQRASHAAAAHPALLTGLVALVAAGLVTGCAVSPTPTISRAADVDLQRFMGDWYVIGNIPTRPERDAFNAVESYTLNADGRIATHFRYREGGFDGPLKTMDPVGRVVPGTNNAVWGMQFFWPVQAEYVIVDVDPEYEVTIVGRSKRDYAWIMSRKPTMPDPAYQAAASRLRTLGYDVDRLRKVPQCWPEAGRQPEEAQR